MHVNDNAAIRQMVLVPPINHSAFFIPKICRTSQPKTHPLAFMGDSYARRVACRIHTLFNICKWAMIVSLLMLAYSAAAQGEVIALGKTAEHTADLLIKKDIVWIALFVAASAIAGMVILGKFMKEMHVEFMKQQVEVTKAVVSLDARIGALKDALDNRPCAMEDKKHR